MKDGKQYKVQQWGAITINLSLTTEISSWGEYLVTCKNILNVLCNEKIDLQYGPNFITKCMYWTEIKEIKPRDSQFHFFPSRPLVPCRKSFHFIALRRLYYLISFKRLTLLNGFSFCVYGSINIVLELHLVDWKIQLAKCL